VRLDSRRLFFFLAAEAISPFIGRKTRGMGWTRFWPTRDDGKDVPAQGSLMAALAKLVVGWFVQEVHTYIEYRV
jgi:hypothetical protein